MKQSIARQYSRHRNHTPIALRLPPPKPPVASKTCSPPVGAAIALPEAAEPLVHDPAADPAPPMPALSRQARRRAQRAEAKALRREGPARPDSAPAPLPAAAAERPGAAIEPVTPPPPGPASPLPRSRALVAGKPRGIALFVQRLRAIFSLEQAYVSPPALPSAENPLAAQLRTVRRDLAALQAAVDRMIEGVAA